MVLNQSILRRLHCINYQFLSVVVRSMPCKDRLRQKVRGNSAPETLVDSSIIKI